VEVHLYASIFVELWLTYRSCTRCWHSLKTSLPCLAAQRHVKTFGLLSTIIQTRPYGEIYSLIDSIIPHTLEL
jgi:hypothetical protein